MGSRRLSGGKTNVENCLRSDDEVPFCRNPESCGLGATAMGSSGASFQLEKGGSMEWARSEYTVITDADRLDFDVIHSYLADVAYWSRGISRAMVEKSARHSLCFGLFKNDAQIGFARLITDHTTFAYLSDVFVLPEFQGDGLGTWFMQCVFSHPDLGTMRRLMLITGDAQKLYEKFGFTVAANPEQIMEKRPLASALGKIGN